MAAGPEGSTATGASNETRPANGARLRPEGCEDPCWRTKSSQPYQSGDYGFVATEMYLSVNHEVAPKEEALGYGPFPDGCVDCHTTQDIEWDKLGWTDDPFNGGDRVGSAPSAFLDPKRKLD